jgi:hypothetical protein
MHFEMSRDYRPNAESIVVSRKGKQLKQSTQVPQPLNSEYNGHLQELALELALVVLRLRCYCGHGADERKDSVGEGVDLERYTFQSRPVTMSGPLQASLERLPD